MAARILVVDDNELSSQFLQDALSLASYEVELACDGEQALERLTRESFDLILLDLKMPRMGGVELLGHLTDARITVPTIIMTGMPEVITSGLPEEEEETIRGYRATCSYLPKPFRSAQLIHIVERMLQTAAEEKP
jgi:two-component system, NtrC family, response regulator PilR